MLAYDCYREQLVLLDRTYVSMSIVINDQNVGSLLFELYSDICPKTCKNFAELCKGFVETVSKNEYESYNMNLTGTTFFRLVPNGWIQGGDVLYGRGDDGRSIYGSTFEDENFIVKHDQRGILSMANHGRHTNASQFFITLQPAKWMDARYVAFGRILEGSSTLAAMESVPTKNDRPLAEIKISEIKVLKGEDIHTKLTI